MLFSSLKKPNALELLPYAVQERQLVELIVQVQQAEKSQAMQELLLISAYSRSTIQFDLHELSIRLSKRDELHAVQLNSLPPVQVSHEASHDLQSPSE